MAEKSIKTSDKLLLSVKEAAQLTGIGINKMQSLVRSPKCKFAIKSGKKHLVKREALQEYIAEHSEI